MKLVALVATAFLLTGCISTKSFVDPGYPKTTYEQIQRKPTPVKLELSTQFQRNGQPFPRADSTLKDNVERVLRASGAVTPVPAGGDGQIRIVVNNIADLGAAAGKGFGTGLTFGLVGSTVTDAYEMSFVITVGTDTFSRTSIRHAIHTTIGNATVPSGLEGLPAQVAFERVLEQMLLRALQDYQAGKAGPADA